ncbi:7TM diverse intracellular signaling domain-containing protein [Bernardetia sp. ABR2-2B]|uniref:7TMR-DISM family protein n=1 Tax=Bernardetia sp. ABR2-2B TaxID=3127472 RepID=UPI0030CA8F1C
MFLLTLQKLKNKTFYYIRLWFFLFFIVGNSMIVFAQNETAHEHAQQEGKRVDLEILKDIKNKNKELTIHEVEKRNKDFVPVKSSYLNLGFEENAKWIRVKIPPHVENKIFYLELEYPLLDSVSLFYKDTISDSWQVKHSGDLLPFYQRDINYHNLIFKIPVSKDSVSYYFRIKTNGSLQVSVKLWNESSLFEEILGEQLVFGGLFGVFMVLAAYSFLIGSLLKTRSYLYYAMLVLSAALFLSVLNGYAFQYLWATAPDWGNQALPFSIGVLTVSALNFTQLFLLTKKHAPTLQKLMQLCSLIAGIVASIVFIGYYNLLTQIVVVNALIAAILIFYTAVITRARGYAFSRFVVSGSYLFSIGILLAVLKSFGIVDTTFITKHGMELGTVFYLLLCAVSLNDRYTEQKVIKKDEQEEEIEEIKDK